MPELTPEERQRIYAEEKARLETRRELESEKRKSKLGTIGVWILWVVVGLLALGIFGMMRQQARLDSLTPEQRRVAKTQSCLTVLTSAWDRYEYTDGEKRSAILGAVRNDCGVTVGSAFIEFNILDPNRAQVGTAIDHTSNLGAGVTWRFKASVVTSQGYADSFSLAKATAYR